MQSGYHKHYCPKCKTEYLCQLITHCRQGFEWTCAGCMGASTETTETGYEPDDPKNPRWWK